MSTKRVSLVIATAALAATLMLGILALPAQAALRHIDGTVLSRSAAKHSFRITTQSGRQLRVKVNSSTRFERIQGGFGGLRKGMRIEVEAKQTSSGLLAVHVETRGGGGGDDHGGGGGGADDGPNHT
jgi:hypothetical protein